jgi:biopolymer transport protein ExbB
LPIPFLSRFGRVLALALLPAAMLLATEPATAQAPAAPAASAVAVSTPAVAANGAANNGDVENPYGLEALWRGSDSIARGVLVLLAIMSAGSWYIMVTKLLEPSRIQRHARTMTAKVWTAPTVSAGAGAL